MTTPKDPAPSVPPMGRVSVPPDGIERRSHPRFDVTWAVDCECGDTFLYSYITNISAMGIFIASLTPPSPGTRLTLRFTPPGKDAFEIQGEVAWINPWREDGENINPGFGVRFIGLDASLRERVVDLVRAIAYLPDTPETNP